MRRLLTLFFLLLAAPALAQVSVQTRSGDSGPLWFDSSNQAFIPGHIINTGRAPVLTTCGTAPAIVGSDLAGTVTTGTGDPEGCVITFATAFAAAPHCVLGWSTGVLAAMSWVTTATAITVTQTAASSAKINYVCIGKR